jgi:outer membrane protein W
LVFLLLASFSIGHSADGKMGVSLGVRGTYFRMTEARGNIYGNIIGFDENQNYAPYKPFLQLHLSKYWAVEFGYDKFKATSFNRGQGDPLLEGSHDGDLEWSPFMLALQFRLPDLHKSLVPYLSWGISYNTVSFNSWNWYRYGFPDPSTYDSWVSQGNRPEDYTDYRRDFTTDNTLGTFIGLGLDYYLTSHWALNLDWRQHWAKTNFKHLLWGREAGSGTFTLDCWVLGLGVKYSF